MVDLNMWKGNMKELCTTSAKKEQITVRVGHE